MIKMKHIKIISLIIMALVFNSCQGQEDKKAVSFDENISKIEVIDFHSTHRCVTCKSIEKNTQYTLDTFFNKEIEEGKITFQIINIDDKSNYDMAKKFRATSTSLFLNVVRNGKERKIDLTDFAFLNGKNQEKFSTGFKSKLEKQLAKL